MEFPKDFETRGLWIPSTPAKPTPTTRPLPVSGSSWLESVDVTRGTGRPWRAVNRGPATALALGDGELKGMVTDDVGRRPAQMPYRMLSEAAERGDVSRYMGFPPLMAATRATGGGSVPLNAEASNWNRSALNGGIFLHPGRGTQNSRLLSPLVPELQLKFPVHPTPPNLNSSPEINRTCRVVSEALTSRATPATVEKCQHDGLYELLCHEMIDLVSETGSCQDDVKQQNERNHAAVNTSEVMPAQQAEGENQEADLNRTPQQKPKRKKHRPKVIRERKPARKLKPETPKSANPLTAKTQQNPSGKRKYMRKKNGPIPQENPTSTPGEVVDQDIPSWSKSVRRSLNFDLVDASLRSAPVSQIASETRAHMISTVKFLGGVGFEINGRLHRLENGNVRTPQTPNQPSQPSRLEMESMKAKFQGDFRKMVNKLGLSLESEKTMGENVKKLAKKNIGLGIAGDSESDLVDDRSQGDPIRNLDLLLKGTKRDHSNLVDDARVLTRTGDKYGCNDTGSTDTCVDEIQKKRRIENEQKAMTFNSSTVLTYTPQTGWRTFDGRNGVSTFADSQSWMAHEKRQAWECMLMSNQAEKKKNNKFHAHTTTSACAVADRNKESTLARASDHYQKEHDQPSTPQKAPEQGRGLGNATDSHQALTKILTGGQPISRGRKMKDQVHLVNSTSHTSQIEHAAAAAAYKTASLATELAPQNLFAASAPLRSSPVQEHQNNRGSASPRFMAGTVVSYCDPVDDLTQKLEHLKINGGDLVVTGELTNAVVPYAGGGMMVSFQGSFDVIKKRKPRAKVDLDPESNRVWKLLMGMETSEAEEGTEANKEKWWEEERRVFCGRVDSFIARMHLIQGDRRFSRWKGSVVDSVIGVFLTQNVSDHLSSSAFMSLAARFPLQSNGNNNNPRVEIISRPLPANDSAICQGKALKQEMCDRSSQRINDSEEKENKETASNNESLEGNYSLRVNDEERSEDNSKENGCGSCARELGVDFESPDSASVTAATVTSCNSAIEGEDRRTVEDVVSSQNSVVSSQSSSEFINQTGYQERLTPLLNFEADALLGGGNSSGNSFMDLMEMVGNGKISSAEYANQNDWSAHLQSCNVPASVDGLGASTYSSNSDVNPLQHDFMGFSCAPSYHHENLSHSRFMGLENAKVIRGQRYQSNSTFSSLKINETGINEMMGRQYHCSTGTLIDSTDQNKILAPKTSCQAYSCMPISKKTIETVAFAGLGDCVEKRCCQSEASSSKIISDTCAHQEDVNTVKYPHKKSEVLLVESTQESVGSQFQNLYCGSQTCTNFHIDNQRKSFDSTKRAESNFRNEACTSEKLLTEIVNKASKGKKVKPKNEKSSYDWDSLRKQSCENGVQRERSKDTMDSLDYEALRNADVNEISHTIRDRGMNNVLAERIKDFLNRLVNDHGSVDLEWLRDVPPDKAKDYLLSIRGLGLKSVECVRLLTLRHLAFPVDTNVGRICVRLGWVPLQPLPESLKLHLLEMYPVLETIQKYLWPRLCKLDQLTLYELHYQLITFGKVFCTKSKPNCNACPMRGECKHFASAFASSRLVLPGPEEKGLVRSGHPSSFENGHSLFHNPTPVLQLEGRTLSFEQAVPRNCKPIIEEPATPEPELECTETSEIDIEDAFYNDPDEIPTIKLDFEEFTNNLQSYIQEKNMGLQDGDMSKALVALTPEAASIPMPKLKNVNRLRTEHLVYELQDSHPLLEGMDKREPDDPCPYLLAIWTPGETAQSTEPPTACCNSHDTGKFCDNRMCFSCNSIREAQAQTVRGTLLIPCRTANRGSFPLNGTYFQVNEVFADHFSSCNPIDVPRNYIWNVPRRTVYFGTSIPSIFKGLTTEGIQHCFWRGFVCVRGFDRVTRAPKPLFARLHFPAGKSTRNKRTVAAATGNQE